VDQDRSGVVPWETDIRASLENNVLYTAYRRDTSDVVVALSATTGETIWETPCEAPFTNAYSESVGPGPYAMPQVIGDRIVMATGDGNLLSLDRQNGNIVWSHHLMKEFHGTQLPFGYSSHVLPYKGKLITLVGGQVGMIGKFTGASGSAAIAFNQTDGSVAWKGLEFENAHSTPLLIEVDGEQQVVGLLAQEVVGFSPDSGALLWRHPHPTGNGLAVSLPVWGSDHILIVSSAYGGGTRALELHQTDGQTTVRELWHTLHAQAHHGTLIRVDDHVYLSSGEGPAFMVAVNVATGQLAWKERGLAKAQLLWADGKFILLDEEGVLALASATPQKFEVVSQASVLKRIAWTPPTLVGTRLYLRDRENIMALELADSSQPTNSEDGAEP
jgi:outer membrane protein assembly factor BamB